MLLRALRKDSAEAWNEICSLSAFMFFVPVSSVLVQ
jgi:hypothetical protein